MILLVNTFVVGIVFLICVTAHEFFIKREGSETKDGPMVSPFTFKLKHNKNKLRREIKDISAHKQTGIKRKMSNTSTQRAITFHKLFK